jgi:hypothetical protein
VYLCEDIHGVLQPYNAFIDGLIRPLSDFGCCDAPAQGVHQHIASMHRYPLVTVIEKPDRSVERFQAPRHGTQWQPWV